MGAAASADLCAPGAGGRTRSDAWVGRAMRIGVVAFLAANMADAATAAMTPIPILSQYDLNPLVRALAPAGGPIFAGVLIKGMGEVFTMVPCAFVWRVGGLWAKTAVASVFWIGAAAGLAAAYMNIVNGILP
jgi:hypothetical protein